LLARCLVCAHARCLGCETTETARSLSRRQQRHSSVVSLLCLCDVSVVSLLCLCCVSVVSLLCLCCLADNRDMSLLSCAAARQQRPRDKSLLLSTCLCCCCLLCCCLAVSVDRATRLSCACCFALNMSLLSRSGLGCELAACEVATSSRLLKMIGLFCKRAL